MADLSRQRAALQRGLRRANFAWFVIVSVIGALAVGVVWKAGQSTREAERANQNAVRAEQEAERANAEASRANAATVRAEQELWNARFTEARAVRRAGGPDARVRSSRIVGELAHTPVLSDKQRLALRNEAIAGYGLADVELPLDFAAKGVGRNAVWDAAFERYAIGEGSGDLKIYESKSGKVVHSFPVPTGFLRELVVFSPDGRYLAGVFKRTNSRVMAWRIADGSLVVSNLTVSSQGYDRPFFSPDSRVLALYERSGLTFFDLASSESVGRLPTPESAVFSPDSSRLAVLSQGGVKVLSASGLNELSRVKTEFEPSVIAWHPDGTQAAIGGTKGELVIWSPAGVSNLFRRFDGHSSRVVKLTFSDNGSLLLSWGWDTFSSVWDVQSGRRLLADPRIVIQQQRSATGEIIAEAGASHRRGKARLLTPTGFRTVLRTERIGIPAAEATFSDDGSYVATDYIGFTRLWHAETGREFARVVGRSPVFLGNSNLLLTCSPVGVFRHDFSAWTNAGFSSREPRDGVEIFRHKLKPGPDEWLNSISLNRDGRTLAVSACAEGVALLDLAGEKPVRWVRNLYAHYASVSTGGDWMLTQFHNGESYLVPLMVSSYPERIGWRFNTAFCPDGRLLAAASTERISVAMRNETNGWNWNVNAPTAEVMGSNTQLAFSPDGRWLAMNTNRFEVHLFEARTLRLLATFTPPSGSPIGGRSLAFSPDGRFLRVLLQDGDLVEWDIPVMRAELAKLGLDWETSHRVAETEIRLTTNVVGTSSHAAHSSPVVPPAKVSSAPAVAVGTGAFLAIGAGVFLFFHQRRALRAYTDAESLAAQQQHKLTQAQDALFQSRKMEALGTLAAGVAHDFNNLLSIIRMSNQLVKRAVKSEGVTKENLEAIEQAVQQGKAIVNSMLGYSRRPAEAVEEFAVAKVVGDTVGLLSRQFLSGLILNVQIDPETPAIVGSPTRLEQVLLNLIVNASEAMKGSGTLSISARPASRSSASVLQLQSTGNSVELVVADSGPGIPPAVLSRIFEPFFTTKTAGAQRGTGLGLSMVYAIARDDGWGLDVTTVEGKGTAFRMLLPAAGGDPGGRRLPTSRKRDGPDNIASEPL